MLHYLHLVCECQFCERTAVLRPVAVAGAILVVVAPAFCTMLVTSVSAKLILPNTFEEKRMLNHKPKLYILQCHSVSPHCVRQTVLTFIDVSGPRRMLHELPLCSRASPRAAHAGRHRCKTVTIASNHSSAEHHQSSKCCSGWHLRCGCQLSAPIAAGARFLRAHASVCRCNIMHEHKTVSALADSLWRLCNQAAGTIISASFEGAFISHRPTCKATTASHEYSLERCPQSAT